MIKLVGAIRRRPDMTHSEYSAYVRDVHGSLAVNKNSTVATYIQNHVFDSAYGATGDPGYQLLLPRDSVTELWFENADAMKRNLADPYSREVVMADGVNFNDFPSALSLLVEQRHLDAPDPGSDGVKVLLFLKAAEGVGPQEFQERWRQAHEEVVADASGPGRLLRGHEWNTALPTDGMGALFGDSEQPSYEAYSALWFDEADALTAFRAYREALTERAQKQGPFHRPSLSFFLLSREIVIFDERPGHTTGA
ncbi:EthD domain-containing protein [Streptomyces sp. YKOK-I1]